MIAQTKLFSSDPSHMFDFAKTRPSEIFNKAILPNVNSFLDLIGDDPAGLEDAAQRRNAELGQRVEQEALNSRVDQDFVEQLNQRQPQQQQPVFQPEAAEDYDSPVAAPVPTSSQPLGAQVRSAPVAKNLTDFVKHFEGYNPNAYDDFKQMSIGYGTRARKGETSISKEEAENRLAYELSKSRSQVESLNRNHGYDFNENELDALTSFTYNVGSLDQLTENGKRDKGTIGQKILEYNKAGGKVLKGLVNRREAEHNLFTQGY